MQTQTEQQRSAQLWANSSTLLDLQNLAKQHSILLPPKLKKIEIVELLMKNKVSRSAKRKATQIDANETNCIEKKPKNSPRKIKKVERLVQKIKHELNEPLELHTSTSENGLKLLGDNLVVRDDRVVGKFMNGNITFLNEHDVEKAIGARVDFDLLKFVPTQKPTDEKIYIEEYFSDEEGDEEDDEN